MFSVRDQVIVISGGLSGIGLATAQRLASAGAQIVIVDRSAATAEAQELGWGSYVVDVTDEHAVRETAEQVLGAYGRIDALVCCAGVFADALVEESTADDWTRCFQVNTLGTANMMKHIGARIERGGSVVTISSAAGIMPTPMYSAYGASKAAVAYLSQVAALELGPRGIRVNTICPGSVNTPMLASQDNRDEEVAMMGAASPLGRIIDPSEVAALIHFLVAPDCGAITGTAIPIDGGLSTGITMRLVELAGNDVSA